MNKPNLSKEEVRLCFLRSICVAGFVLLALALAHIYDNTIWAISLGATAFIAFAFPNAQAVRVKVIIGGYVSACICGVLLSLLLSVFNYTYIATLLLSGIAVFFTTLLMTLLDNEHPPAAALAIGLIIADDPLSLAGISLVAVIILCLIKGPIARIILREHDK